MDYIGRYGILLIAVALFVALGFIVPVLLNPAGIRNVSGNVTLVVSEDFGHNIIGVWEFGSGIDASVMEILRNLTEVETRYGGLFLYSIFNLTSDIKQQKDWLYYVNGAYMGVGLATYRPNPGEVVQLDYHYWGGYPSSPGFLSGYPEKFVYGVGGRKGNVTVICPAELHDIGRWLAGDLEKWLGYRPVVVDSLDDAASGDIVLLTTTENPRIFNEIREWRPSGLWPVLIEGDDLLLTNLTGSEVRLDEGCGVQCMGFVDRSRWALMVLASDESWIRKGVSALNRDTSLRYVCAFAIDDSGAILLPVI